MLVFVCEGTVGLRIVPAGSLATNLEKGVLANGCGSVSVELYASNWSYDFSYYNPI